MAYTKTCNDFVGTPHISSNQFSSQQLTLSLQYLLRAPNHAAPLFITALLLSLSVLAKQPFSGPQLSVVIHQAMPITLPTDH